MASLFAVNDTFCNQAPHIFFLSSYCNLYLTVKIGPRSFSFFFFFICQYIQIGLSMMLFLDNNGMDHVPNCAKCLNISNDPTKNNIIDRPCSKSDKNMKCIILSLKKLWKLICMFIFLPKFVKTHWKLLKWRKWKNKKVWKLFSLVLLSRPAFFWPWADFC